MSNLKCLICGRIFTSEGIHPHIRFGHKEKPIEGTNFKKTKTNSTTTKTKHKVLECKLCGRRLGSKGIGSHTTRKHHRIAEEGETYIIVGDAPIKKRKYTKRKPQPVILKPEMSYIDIPAVIRVPLTMGMPTIISTESA